MTGLLLCVYIRNFTPPSPLSCAPPNRFSNQRTRRGQIHAVHCLGNVCCSQRMGGLRWYSRVDAVADLRYPTHTHDDNLFDIISYSPLPRRCSTPSLDWSGGHQTVVREQSFSLRPHGQLSARPGQTIRTIRRVPVVVWGHLYGGKRCVCCVDSSDGKHKTRLDASCRGTAPLLLHFISHFHSQTSSNEVTHLLTGCVATHPPTSPSSLCGHTFVLDASVSLSTPSSSPVPTGRWVIDKVHIFDGIPAVSAYTDIEIHITSPNGPFSSQDMIYTSSYGERRGLDGVVDVWAVHLSHQQVGRSEASLRASISQQESIPSEGSVLPAGEVRQVKLFKMQQVAMISVCTANSCVAHSLRITPIASAEETQTVNTDPGQNPDTPFQLSLTPVLSCGGTSPVLSFQRPLHRADQATLLVCTSLHGHDSDGEEGSRTCPDGSSSTTCSTNTPVLVFKAFENIHIHIDQPTHHELRVNVADVLSLPALSNVFVSSYTSHSGSGSGNTHTQQSTPVTSFGLKALVRSSTGSLQFVQQKEVKWERLECMSRIVKSGLIVMDNIGKCEWV